MFCFYAATPFVSIAVEGGLRQGIGLVFLGTWYNNFGGADYHPVLRNSINALGYLCFLSGAMEVALAASLPLTVPGSSLRLLRWFVILAGVILTTIHTQDMYDQEGDAIRNRRTMPLVIGDGLARWMTAFSMLVWGIVCPVFWEATLFFWNMSLGLAALVGIRTLVYRSVSTDKRTFVIWNIWVSLLYILPLFSSAKA
jgi:4-hydroxybenzoate polyprenyltransferase